MNNTYPVKLNDIAFVKYSDEPVFVIKITKNDEGQDTAIVRRRIEASNGAKYEQDSFLLAELESEKAHVIVGLEMTKFQAEQRDKYSREYQAAQKAAAAGPATAVSDPTGYAN